MPNTNNELCLRSALLGVLMLHRVRTWSLGWLDVESDAGLLQELDVVVGAEDRGLPLVLGVSDSLVL